MNRLYLIGERYANITVCHSIRIRNSAGASLSELAIIAAVSIFTADLTASFGAIGHAL